MEVYYPLFERNRILKKEMLGSIRDYAFFSSQLAYQSYGEGILQGCDVRVNGKKLLISPGMIKYKTWICFRIEEESIEYVPSEQTQIVKIRFQKRQQEDGIQYQMSLFSDENLPLEENELEVCRYQLQKGAKLRDQYKNFEDMGTEYDILNFIFASWGGLHGEAIAPMITRRFAEEILKAKNCKPEDICFAYLCLSQAEAVPKEIVCDYIRRKNSCELKQNVSNQEIFQEMCKIWRKRNQITEEDRVEVWNRRRILVD